MNIEKIKDSLLEIKLLVDMKVVAETLSRIGIANKRQKILYPSCYVIENESKYYLAHFKQLFLLARNSAYNAICDDDILRRNAIAFCLKEWELIDVPDELIVPHNKYIYVLPYSQKNEWSIKHKFNLRSLI
jgi:hypothetical protein